MEVYRDLIAEQLAAVINRRCIDFRTPQVIRILGLPACGKSSLAASLVRQLATKDRRAVIFEDAFEIEFSRQERQRLALSGIDYESFDLSSLLRGLGALLEGRPTDVQPYEHGGGSTEARVKTLSPCDVIILDGFAWQHPTFRTLLGPRVCYTITLVPSSFDLWRELSIDRDIEIRGYSRDLAYKEFASKQATFLAHAVDLPGDQLDTYFSVSRRDRRRDFGDQYIYMPGEPAHWPPLDLKAAQRKHVFLASKFSDDELVNGLQLALIDRKYVVHKGNHVSGSISKGILSLIRRSAIFIGVFTYRDALKSGLFTSSSWLLEEKGAALMAGKPVLLMVEDCIDPHYVGYLQGDVQRVEFNRNSFGSKVWDVLRVLDDLSGSFGQ